jgi:methanogenic corrinoid protein MtbC1
MQGTVAPRQEVGMNDCRMSSLIAAILDGDCAEAVSQAEHLARSGALPQHIVIQGVEAAMTALDAKCTVQHFNLLEIMLAGRAVMEVMKFLYPAGMVTAESKATVLVASLEGDVHDLGKNILKIVLIGGGYHVVDCGKDCPLPKLVEAAETNRPLAVGISGLITSIIPAVRQVKDALLLRKLERVKVIAGGAALKQASAGELNVDFVAESAFDGLHYLDRLAGGHP